jgi:hypothetical protein
MSIARLHDQIAEDPSRALALDDVRQGTLAQMKVNPDKPDSDKARAIAQYLKNQQTQKLGGDVLASGLTVGAVIGSVMAPEAAWPFWLGAAATGASVATGVRDYNESVTIDLAAQAQQGGAGNLTSKDKDEARFDLMMGQTNLLLAGLDVGLTAKATTGLLKSSAKTAAAFSKIKPAQLAQVMKEVSAGNLEKARSVLRTVGQVSDEVADEIVRSFDGLRGERLAIEGGPGNAVGDAIDPKQPMQMRGNLGSNTTSIYGNVTSQQAKRIRKLLSQHNIDSEAPATKKYFEVHSNNVDDAISKLENYLQNPSPRLRNHDFAGRHFTFDTPELRTRYPGLAEKYPKGVRFTKDGYPDFSPYSVTGGNVKIDMAGNYTTDFTEATKLARKNGVPEDILSKIGSEYTWHHSEDMRTMQLVPRDIHRAVRHDGGISRMKVLKKLSSGE